MRNFPATENSFYEIEFLMLDRIFPLEFQLETFAV